MGVDRDSTAQKYYVTRDEVTWSAKLGTKYNTTSWSCNINRSGNILVGSMEIETSQGSTSITFPSYSRTTTDVFCRFTNHTLVGYYECIVTVDGTTYPAFISSGNNIGGTNYTAIVLRVPITITANKNIKVAFFAFLDNA